MQDARSGPVRQIEWTVAEELRCRQWVWTCFQREQSQQMQIARVFGGYLVCHSGEVFCTF
jgi:hypothetical protein